MNEQVWYVYQNGQQLGPFAAPQIRQMVVSKMIPQDAYLFKVGWKDWRPIEETMGELDGGDGAAEAGAPGALVSQDHLKNRRASAPRATIQGRVVVHNDGQLVIGTGVNISATGMFVETQDQLFTVGERLKLSVRADAFRRPFNVIAEVVRYNADPKYPVGYGLRFEDLDDAIGKEIQAAVDIQNKDADGHQAAR